MKRLSKLELPPYRFIPGYEKHPEKEGGYLYGKKKVFKPLDNDNYKSNEQYLYAIDLFNMSYYWESHVYWEGLWNIVGRKGVYGDFLKALIKIAAAGVKFQLKQVDPAQDHIKRAGELMAPLPDLVLGVRGESLFQGIRNEKSQELGVNFSFQTKIVLF